MSTRIKVVQSPFQPPVEVAEDLVIMLSAPYSSTEVTVQINPNIQAYQEKVDTEGGIDIRQAIATTGTDETVSLFFDLEDNKIKEISFPERDYKVELLSIGDENIKGKDFKYYEFEVTRL